MEFLLEEGFDVYLVGWGIAGDEEGRKASGLDDTRSITCAPSENCAAAVAPTKSPWLVVPGAAISGIYLALTPDAPSGTGCR